MLFRSSNNAVEYFVSYYDYYQPEAYVPASDTYIEKDASINEQIEQMRLSATKALLERKDVIIIASVSAIYGLGDPDSYMKMLLHLSVGEIINQREILLRLAEMQYTRNDVTLLRGTFRVKGEVIDIFPADSEERAIRVEMFDNEVERLYWFDPLTGEKLKPLQRITIYPKTHYVTPHSTILNVLDDIKLELSKRKKVLIAEQKLVEDQRLSQRVMLDMEMMRELGYCSGIENYSRYLSGRKEGEPPPTLMDYLPDDALVILDESHVSVSQIRGMYNGDRSRKKTLVDFGFRLPSALDNRPLKFEEWDMMRTQTVFVSATPGPWELKQTDNKYIDQIIRPTGLIDPPVEIKPAKTQVDNLMHEAAKVIKNGYRVLATTLTKKMAEDLTEYLHENGLKVRYMHSDIDTLERIEIIRDLRLGVFDILVGINLLREGLDIPECGLVAILDADKEGFLRSETSLIQTIGRAARNIDGKVILYADKVTKSIDKAIKETDRRRAKQSEYNKKNNITAESIKKEIGDILESVYEKDYVNIKDSNIGGNLKKHLKGLKKKMKESAANLEFEEAAKIRDEIRKLEASELEITLNPKISQYNLKNKVYPKGRSTLGMPGTKIKKQKKLLMPMENMYYPVE